MAVFRQLTQTVRHQPTVLSSFAYNHIAARRWYSPMTDFHEVSGPVRCFAEHLLRVFPEWADAIECPGMGDAVGDCSFCVVPPQHPTHRLYVVTRRSSSVE